MTRDDFITRMAAEFVEACIERDPVVKYTLRGMKLNEWQKLAIREQDMEQKLRKPYMIVGGRLYLERTYGKNKDTSYELVTFGDKQ